ncbi:MAG: flavodoxin family protein [Desulfobacterota bacterium]|nr:flavodoxin family protein [Thermodesulfobacteriota bacterium]
MKVLGIYGSPRPGGNSDLLLDRALAGAAESGADLDRIYVRDLKISGCLECGGCDETGACVVPDDMDDVYPRLQEAEVIIMAAPMFFYGVPAQLKALVDRSQALWAGRRLEKTPDQWKIYDHGQGYFIAVGATKGQTMFDGSKMMAKYFYDALDKSYEGGLFYARIEKKGTIRDHPQALQEAYELGRKAVAGDKSQ